MYCRHVQTKSLLIKTMHPENTAQNRPQFCSSGKSVDGEIIVDQFVSLVDGWPVCSFTLSIKVSLRYHSKVL